MVNAKTGIQYLKLPDILSFILLLLKFRWTWYLKIMKARLIRSKHGIIILIALLAPTVAAVNYVITEPFNIIIKSSEFNGLLLVNLFLLYVIYVLWMSIQKAGVSPSAANQYIEILPINKRINRLVDLLIVVIANNFMWIPVLLVFNQISTESNSLVHFFRLIALISMILFLQINVLKSNFYDLVIFSMTNLIFIVSFSVFNKNINMSILTYFFIAGVIWYRIFNNRSREIFFKNINFLSEIPSRLIFKNSLMNFFHFPIYFSVFFRKYKTTTYIRFLLAILMVILGTTVTSSLGISYAPKIAVLVFILITYTLSGLFPIIREERNMYGVFLNTLPYSKISWVFRDLFITVWVLSPLLIGYLLIISCLFKISLAFDVSVYLLMLPLLTILYFLQAQKNLGNFLCIIVCCLWLFALANFLG